MKIEIKIFVQMMNLDTTWIIIYAAKIVLFTKIIMN